MLPDVETVRAAREGYGKIVVDDERNSVPAGNAGDPGGEFGERAVVKLLFPQLDDGRAAEYGLFYLLFEGMVSGRYSGNPAPVGDRIEAEQVMQILHRALLVQARNRLCGTDGR